MFQSFFELFFLASFTFCLSSILFQNLTRFLSHYTFFRFVLLQSLVVQFSMTNLLKPLKVTASLLYHKLFRFVKYFFQLFKTFFEVFVPPRVCDLVILPHLSLFVNTFFESFFIFLKLFLSLVIYTNFALSLYSIY